MSAPVEQPGGQFYKIGKASTSQKDQFTDFKGSMSCMEFNTDGS